METPPQFSLRQALNLADVIAANGGELSIEAAAEQRNLTPSSLKQVVSTPIKFGLVQRRRGGPLATTTVYKRYQEAPTSEMKAAVLRDAFMNVPIYRELYRRYVGREVPAELGDMAAEEFGLERYLAARLRGNFIEGLKQADLWDNVARKVRPMDGQTVQMNGDKEDGSSPIYRDPSLTTSSRNVVTVQIGKFRLETDLSEMDELKLVVDQINKLAKSQNLGVHIAIASGEAE